MNALTGAILGVYLVAVALHGNGKSLIDALKREGGFIPWAVALVLLYLAYTKTKNKVLLGLLVLTFAAFFIQAGSGLLVNLQGVFARLKGK